MKLLEQFYDENVASELAWKFREKGILTHVSSQNSHQLGSIKTGALKVGLWVVLEKQYTDAEMLHKNENHKVMYPLSEEEMLVIENEAKESFSNEISISYTKVANKAMILALFGLIAFVSYQVINAL